MIPFIIGIYTIKYLGIRLTRNVKYEHDRSYKMQKNTEINRETMCLDGKI